MPPNGRGFLDSLHHFLDVVGDIGIEHRHHPVANRVQDCMLRALVAVGDHQESMCPGGEQGHVHREEACHVAKEHL